MKKLTALLLVIVILLPLISGCRNQESVTTVPASTQTILTTAPATTVAPTISTEPTTESTTAPSTQGATVAPTQAATVAPSQTATVAPTQAATAAPTQAPTVAPTQAPTVAPTQAATAAPTTVAPTQAPTEAPVITIVPVVCNHDYKIVDTVDATCSKSGMMVYACANCGHGYQLELPKTAHSFADATCTAPKTCTACGTTEGKSLGHSFAEATCTARKTCTSCGVTEGKALGHTFAAATCLAPKTCTVCRATEGTIADHRYVDNKCTVCGKINTNFSAPAGGYDGSPVTITFYHTLGANLRSVLGVYIERFNKLYPNITVQDMSVGGWSDIKDQIKDDISSGIQPNIAYCYPDHVAEYIQTDSVVQLDALITSTIVQNCANGTTEVLGLTKAQIDDFIPGFYESGRVFGDGLMYSLPMSKTAEVMYYNKTFFDEHGLSVPTNWDEMEALCKKIKQIDPGSIPLGYDSEANWFINMAAQLDSPYTSAGSDHLLFDNDTNKAFVKRFRQWFQSGYVTTQELYGAYTSGLFTNLDSSKARGYMSIGSAAGARFQLPVTTNQYGDSVYAFEVGVAPIPASGSSHKVLHQGPNLCILNSKNPQETVASWLFVKYLATNPDFQAEFSMASGYMPVTNSAANHRNYRDWLSKADGSAYINALTSKVCLEQKASYFTPAAFVGSEAARLAVGNLMTGALSQIDNGNVDKLIDKLFKEALENAGTPGYDGTGPKPVVPVPALPQNFDRITIHHLADNLYATGVEYLYTSSIGREKKELNLTENKAEALPYTFIVNADNTVSFKTDCGKYLYCDANSVEFVTEMGDYTKFVLEPANGGYYIRCAVANFAGRPQYLEVYAGYLTCYSMSEGKSELYTFVFDDASGAAGAVVEYEASSTP